MRAQAARSAENGGNGPPSADGRRPRVLLVTNVPGVAGVTRVLQLLASGLAEHGFEVRAVLPTPTYLDAERLAWFRREAPDLEAHEAIPRWDARHDLRSMLRFARFIRRARADLVCLHYGNNFIPLKDVLAVRLAGKRCVVMVHHHAPLSDRHRARMTALAARLAERVIVSTPATQQLLAAAGVPAERISVIPLGIEVPPALPTQAEARARLGLPAEAFAVASVARLVAEKRTDDLIRAVASLDDRRTHLVVAGAGPQLDAVRALASTALGDRGRVLGFVPNVQDVYAAADVFAMASQEEGFGLVYLEAAAHEVPSIGTRVGGVESVIADGRTGLLVPPGDVAALTAQLARLRDDATLRTRLGHAAHARLLAHFAAEQMAARHAELLRAVLSAGRRATRRAYQSSSSPQSSPPPPGLA